MVLVVRSVPVGAGLETAGLETTPAVELAPETGQTVVVVMTSLVTWPILAGQSVTSGLQEVMV